MSEDLKPCPFCGSDEIIPTEDGYPGSIMCARCSAEMPYLSLDHPQSVRWNTRAPLPADKNAVEARFELYQDDMMQAGVEGPREDAMREIAHYAAVYGQDGPVEIFEIIRRPVAIAALSGHGE